MQIVLVKTGLKKKSDVATLIQDNIPEHHFLEKAIRFCLSEDQKDQQKLSIMLKQQIHTTSF